MIEVVGMVMNRMELNLLGLHKFEEVQGKMNPLQEGKLEPKRKKVLNNQMMIQFIQVVENKELVLPQELHMVLDLMVEGNTVFLEACLLDIEKEPHMELRMQVLELELHKVLHKKVLDQAWEQELVQNELLLLIQ